MESNPLKNLTQPAPDTAAGLVQKRQGTHGDPALNFAAIQQLKGVCKNASGWKRMGYIQREAVDMICVKLGRIVTGDPLEPDHWADIQGYAEIAKRNPS